MIFAKNTNQLSNQMRIENGLAQRQRASEMSLSEMMTIEVHFHQKKFRNFKTYYTEYVAEHLIEEFPQWLSYSRFIQLKPRILVALCAYLQWSYGSCTGLSFVDSSALAVCHNRRINQHRVFEDVAERGRTSVDWFYGFKLHLVVNDCGEILACYVTSGNVDDRQPVPKLMQQIHNLFGKIFADKGYLSAKLTQDLFETYRVQLVTRLRKSMKNKLIDEIDKYFLRKRAILESIYD